MAVDEASDVAADRERSTSRVQADKATTRRAVNTADPVRFIVSPRFVVDWRRTGGTADDGRGGVRSQLEEATTGAELLFQPLLGLEASLTCMSDAGAAWVRM